MSHELLLETLNNTLDSRTQRSPHRNVCKGLDVFEKYLEKCVSADSYLLRSLVGGAVNLESEQFILTAKNITGKPLKARVSEVARGDELYISEELCGISSYYTQSSVPVEPPQIMDAFEGVSEPSIRVIQRFFSRFRLYRSHPVYEVLREWEAVESVVLGIFGFPLGSQGELQTRQALCNGGKQLECPA